MMTLVNAAEHILSESLGVKARERFLVVTDTEKRTIGEAFFSAGKELESEAILLVMTPREADGEEPPEAVAAAMRHADVFVAPTARSLSHTRARRDACTSGARGATLPGITHTMMRSRSMMGRYTEVRDISQRLLQKLQGTHRAILRTKGGTELTLEFSNRMWRVDDGVLTSPGSFGNLPAGEVYIAPFSAEGIVVFDASVSMLGMLEEPIRITVRKGEAVAFEGGRQAQELERIVRNATGHARNIAELGIGTNPWAAISGNTLQDEKVAGTVHVALGDNSTIGGMLEASIHLDGVMARDPRLTVDGEDVALPCRARGREHTHREEVE